MSCLPPKLPHFIPEHFYSSQQIVDRRTSTPSTKMKTTTSPRKAKKPRKGAIRFPWTFIPGLAATRYLRILIAEFFSPPDPDDTIFTLPREILQDIADYLPPTDAMSLSMTCKQIHTSLPVAKYAKKIQKDFDAQLQFFERLVKDHDPPTALICGYCANVFWWKQEGSRWTVKCDKHWAIMRPWVEWGGFPKIARLRR